MTLTRRGVTVLALAVSPLLMLAAPSLPDCQTVTLTEDTAGTGDPLAADLLSRGWFGVPTDHAERLYSPACR